jgi:hypothetical protein
MERFFLMKYHKKDDNASADIAIAISLGLLSSIVIIVLKALFVLVGSHRYRHLLPTSLGEVLH